MTSNAQALRPEAEPDEPARPLPSPYLRRLLAEARDAEAHAAELWRRAAEASARLRRFRERLVENL